MLSSNLSLTIRQNFVRKTRSYELVTQSFFSHSSSYPVALIAIEIEFVVERLQADSQQLGGARLIVLRFLKCANNHLPLDFFNRRSHRQRNRVFFSQAFALVDRIGSEVVPLDLFA